MRTMKWLLLLALLLLPVLRTPVQAAPVNSPSAAQIADALISRDLAAYNRGMEELQAADAATCEALGAEINRRGVREADTILTAVGHCQTPNALIAAFVALENDSRDVRNLALDAMLVVPFSVSARCGEDYLKGARRQRLFEILTTSDELALRCDAVRLNPDGGVDSDPRVAINLALLADRFYGAAGFTGTLRGLARVMVGSDVPFPADAGARPERKPGEPLASFNKRDRQWAELQAERDRKLAEFNAALRRRQAAEMLFRSIWVADLTQFNYVVVSSYGDREAAVNRMLKRLENMEAQPVELGERTFRGMRSGEHLMELWTSDVAEFKAAGYIRMRAMAGEAVDLHGKGYSQAVAEFNGLSRRQLAELRKTLKAWWTQYRTQTEPK